MNHAPQHKTPSDAATGPDRVRPATDADDRSSDHSDGGELEPTRAPDSEPDSDVGEEDPGAAIDQPPVEPIYPPGTHGH